MSSRNFVIVGESIEGLTTAGRYTKGYAVGIAAKILATPDILTSRLLQKALRTLDILIL